MTEQEAFDIVNMQRDLEYNDDTDEYTAMSVVMAATDKQIPKKWMVLDGFWLGCPICSGFVRKHEQEDYCGRCGQRLNL